MKEKLLSLIVLFLMGEMTKAQEYIPATRSLQRQPDTAMRKAPMKKADTEATDYWVAAKAHYNEYGYFDASQLTDYNYRASVTINGTEATIDGIMDLGDYDVLTTTSIKGVYDPDKKTITVTTPVYSENKTYDQYTQIATVSYWGDEMALVLFAGEFKYIEGSASYGLDTESKLVFDVSDDMKTITPRSGYGAYGIYTDGIGKGGFVNFFKTASWMAIGDEPRIIVQPDNTHFSGANVTAGAIVTKDFCISNISNTDTSVKINVSNDKIKVYAQKSIKALSTTVCQVEIQPTEEGLLQGTVEIVASNGHTAVMQVTADVNPAPDFSTIVKNGNISFAFDNDLPFVLTDTITGSPVAVSTNAETDVETSTINCLINVPKGKTGIFSWQGGSKSMMPNGTRIYVNGNCMYDNVYAHSGVFSLDDIANTIILKEGDNTVSFVNTIMMNWHQYGMCEEQFKTYIHDLDLQLVDNTDNKAMLKQDNLDFGRHYVDRYATKDTLTLGLLNIGISPLKVTGYRCDGSFSAIVDDASAAHAEELPVKVIFSANAAGDYSEDLVIETTAGEFTVRCKASAEPIIYDYNAIVEDGEFSFNTSMKHPFIIEGNSAISSIAYADMSSENPESWLDIYFIIPEGKEGKLSWEGNNSSADYFDFMGSISHNDGTIITIDDSIVKDYAGEMDASSDTFDEKDLTFGAGMHKVRYLYRKLYATPEGLDRFKLKSLSLQLGDATGINAAMDDSETAIIEIFDISGKKTNTLGRGVNIVRVTHKDGRIETRKVVR